MVYFGDRRFGKAPRGSSRRELMRLVAPPVLLLILIGLMISRQWPRDEERTMVPVRPVDLGAPPADAAPGGTSEERGGRIPSPVVVSPHEPNLPPEPFDPDSSPLASVRDEQIPEPGERERAGLVWLFHRFRAGTEVATPEWTVEWNDLPARKEEIRGQRRRFAITLVEEPIPRLLPANPSGVIRYWEAYGTDPEGHFVLLEFIDKPKILPADSEIQVVADFLRLHRYQMVRGGEGVVPEWVARDVTILTRPPPAPSEWGPLLVVAGIAILAFIPIVWGILRGEGRPRRRTLIGGRARSNNPSAPPPSSG